MAISPSFILSMMDAAGDAKRRVVVNTAPEIGNRINANDDGARIGNNRKNGIIIEERYNGRRENTLINNKK